MLSDPLRDIASLSATDPSVTPEYVCAPFDAWLTSTIRPPRPATNNPVKGTFDSLARGRDVTIIGIRRAPYATAPRCVTTRARTVIDRPAELLTA